ncbi:1-acyl-sn-glycerol-3-phosphate acyltransferase [Candidatus Acetothermia bacterium]|nr:1-acyl-sn-glycerol-3-phosphate acyltransferase [Candidatus Acetothermia bacterium]MBI3643158.1 1-acyl-sn-glycerol-3-phosphate acyltransferase [Candidatus Acetothermia bacterium]
MLRDLIYRIGEVPLTLFLKIAFRFRVIGRENMPKEKGVLLIARHRSYWDIPLMISALGGRNRIHFIARKSLLKNLFFHIFVKHYSIAIDRDNFSKDNFRKVIEGMRQNRIVAIFPEGTTLQTDQVRVGVIRFAEKTKHDFLPIRLECVGPYPPKYPFGFPKVTAYIGKPFSLQDLEERLIGEVSRKERYDQLAEALMEELDETGRPKPARKKEKLLSTWIGL